eukprot:TRINITY_DN5145_c1_g2_i1.p1 TRINITY_DN5145_c1_g2~~TRINITY_DN5145_c1_g2_i1.p1  ORF type:complete len:327 (-),score=49.76 TRINITY_DN5145_c1_g2_i1:76-1056(-)
MSREGEHPAMRFDRFEVEHPTPQPGGMVPWFMAVIECGGVTYEVSSVLNEDVLDCKENAALQGIQGSTSCPSSRSACWQLIRDNVSLWALAPDDDARATARSVPNYFLAAPVKQQLKTVGGVLAACRLRAKEAGGRRWDVRNLLEQVPVIEEHKVVLLEGLAQHVFKVRVCDIERCYKQVYRCTERSFQREIEMLAGLSPHGHIVRLNGVVRCGPRLVVGMLFAYIDGVLLSSIKSASPASCRKWKEQMRSALAHLHHHNRVWGDAKPANIMINRKDDLVLFDFGGIRTGLWVSEELMETPAGDDQAYGRICTFIDGLVRAEQLVA